MASTTYCHDPADRILRDSAGQVYSYDARGNTTKVTNTAAGGVTIFVYDGADRHVKTVTPNGAGGTATVTYARDATGRIIARTASGSATAAENTTTAYGFTAGGDSPDLYLTSSGGTISQRVIGLDGGATHTKHYADPSTSTWAYPNIHGDVITTSGGNAGQATGPIVRDEPNGTPVTTTGTTNADSAPDTAPGAYDAGWLGQHLRYTEHTAGLNYIQMGQRAYDPNSGRFLQVDPIEGGSANDYDYTNADPINLRSRWHVRRPLAASLSIHLANTKEEFENIIEKGGLV